MQIEGKRVILTDERDSDPEDYFKWFNLEEWQYYDRPDQTFQPISREQFEERAQKNKERYPKKGIGLPKEEYKENTIYSLIKELIKVGMVIKAGSRIIPDQPSTPMLYSRTAKVFYTLGPSSHLTKDGKISNVILALGTVLKYHLNKQDFDPRKLQSILVEYESQLKETLEKSLLGVTDERIVEKIFLLSGDDENLSLMDVLGMLEWIITTDKEANEGFRKRLIECFS